MPSSNTEFTSEQARAIQTRDVSIALSAGAGCGKTFVLTERFLSHLGPARDGGVGRSVARLIAITFTDRAAREMRDRIRDKCYQRLEIVAAGTSRSLADAVAKSRLRPDQHDSRLLRCVVAIARRRSTA